MRSLGPHYQLQRVCMHSIMYCSAFACIVSYNACKRAEADNEVLTRHQGLLTFPPPPSAALDDIVLMKQCVHHIIIYHIYLQGFNNDRYLRNMMIWTILILLSG